MAAAVSSRISWLKLPVNKASEALSRAVFGCAVTVLSLHVCPHCLYVHRQTWRMGEDDADEGNFLLQLGGTENYCY